MVTLGPLKPPWAYLCLLTSLTFPTCPPSLSSLCRLLSLCQPHLSSLLGGGVSQEKSLTHSKAQYSSQRPRAYLEAWRHQTKVLDKGLWPNDLHRNPPKTNYRIFPTDTRSNDSFHLQVHVCRVCIRMCTCICVWISKCRGMTFPSFKKCPI